MQQDKPKVPIASIYRIVRIKKNSVSGIFKIYLEEVISPKVRRKGETKVVEAKHGDLSATEELTGSIVEEYYQIAVHNKYYNSASNYFKEQLDLVKAIGKGFNLKLRAIEKPYSRNLAMEERQAQEAKRTVYKGDVHMRKIHKKKKEKELATYFKQFYKMIQSSKHVDYNYAINSLNSMRDSVSHQFRRF